MLGSPVVERIQARPPSLDLRRGFRREVAEVLVERAELLPEPDRRLIEGVFRDGRSIREVAAVWGDPPGPGRDERTLRRRLHRLVRRLYSPEFLVVAQLRERWAPARRRVATACVLHGLSLREAAEALGMSMHTVRRQLDAVSAIVEAACAGAVR